MDDEKINKKENIRKKWMSKNRFATLKKRNLKK